MDALATMARGLMGAGRGLLAMDESVGTCNRRFAQLGIAQTEAKRRDYRDLLVTTPGLGAFISGAILFDETLHQSTNDGRPFLRVLADAGIVPGIKVDAGTVALAGHPGELITAGLDGLRERLASYAAMGVGFAKWRAVLSIGEGLPSAACIDANAEALARYAALAQEAGIVPIVEPELLMDGEHTLARCAAVNEQILHVVFERLRRHGVVLEGMLLKPAMVLPGADCPVLASSDDVADATLRCLRRTVPAAVPGIAFLSGGQSDEQATARLRAMHRPDAASRPWPVTFSYGRALHQTALEHWAGDDANRAAAQQALLQRARANAEALTGR